MSALFASASHRSTPSTGVPSRRRFGWRLSSRSDASSTLGGTVLNPDFKEFLRSLDANKVRYLVVGGYAVALHGYPRYTKDLDIWIDASPDNAARIVQAIAAFGFASLGLQVDDFVQPDTIIQLGYPPNRIDLLTSLPGVAFDPAFDAQMNIEIDGQSVRFIDLEHLRRNKRASGRHQDLADLEQLEGSDRTDG